MSYETSLFFAHQFIFSVVNEHLCIIVLLCRFHCLIFNFYSIRACQICEEKMCVVESEVYEIKSRFVGMNVKLEQNDMSEIGIQTI